MKKILLQLDCDKFASVFDAVTAYDAGVDHVLQYGGVTPQDVRDLVYGEMFTRGGDDLKNSAVFIGGSNVATGEAMLKAARDAFFGPIRVSVMLDANGCNTTAAAAVIKIISSQKRSPARRPSSWPVPAPWECGRRRCWPRKAPGYVLNVAQTWSAPRQRFNLSKSVLDWRLPRPGPPTLTEVEQALEGSHRGRVRRSGGNHLAAGVHLGGTPYPPGVGRR
jgi:hypothetical protein